jgi:uncharacterized membrane protein YkvA (DUF1232 family)
MKISSNGRITFVPIMLGFINSITCLYLGRLTNKWGTGHQSITKVLKRTQEFLNEKKDKIKFLDKVVVLIEMLEAYSEGKYEIDDGTVGLIIAALAYLILPLDLIPDFIAVTGFTDDAAAFVLVFNQLGGEIERFKEWKEKQSEDELNEIELDLE